MLKSWRKYGTQVFGNWSVGHPVTSIDQLEVGMILFRDSQQFDALNLCRVTTCDKGRQLCYATFVGPLDTSNGRTGCGPEPEFAIWNFEIETKEGRTPCFHFAVQAQAQPDPAAPIQMNPLSVYEETGRKAGLASKRKDEALRQFHSSWLRKALALEAEPYRTQAREAFDRAYGEEARPAVMPF